MLKGQLKDFMSRIFLRNSLPSTSQTFNRTLQSFIWSNQSSSPQGGGVGWGCQVSHSVCVSFSFHNRSVFICASAKQYEEPWVMEQHRWINTIQTIWSQHTKGPSCYSLTLLCCGLFVRLCPGCAVAFCVVRCCLLPPGCFLLRIFVSWATVCCK